jgi:hypothetical protein
MTSHARAARTPRSRYQYPEAFNATLSHRRWLCRPRAAHRTHHLHLVDEHTSLGGDREGYSEAKSAFIRRVEADARD